MPRHGSRRPLALLAVLAVAPLGLALGGCGGSSGPAKPTATTHSAATSAKSSPSSASSVTQGPVHATLTASSHRPVAKKNWTYIVTATDAHGHPLAGTTETNFAFQGTVVGHETPKTHRLKHGRLKDTLQFPTMAIGYPVELQVVVHTKAGSVTLSWPVKVLK